LATIIYLVPRLLSGSSPHNRVAPSKDLAVSIPHYCGTRPAHNKLYAGLLMPFGIRRLCSHLSRYLFRGGSLTCPVTQRHRDPYACPAIAGLVSGLSSPLRQLANRGNRPFPSLSRRSPKGEGGYFEDQYSL